MEGKSEMIKIINDSMLNLLNHIKPNTIDSIVTDPPYELNFMNKGWDNTGIAFQKETWQKCYETLKSGGYLLAFGGSRTFHRIACAIEDAGFEIRDCIMWLYGSGFPKSMNIGLAIDKKNGVESKVIGKTKGAGSTGKNSVGNCTFVAKNQYEDGTHDLKQAQNEWQGWGTCLKPAFEPIIVARKPFKGSLVDNVLKYGVGGLNIDECRVELQENETIAKNIDFKAEKQSDGCGAKKCITEQSNQGRFPANVILGNTFNEEWSRYFYCAKASKKDRDEGLDEFEDKKFYSTLNTKNGSGERLDGGNTPIRKNTHPTVKPTELMQYLVRLVTPKGGTILDPFMGSGSTGKAVAYENKERNANYSFIGIELSSEYCEIARARIEYVEKQKKTEKLSIFDFIGE